ncbi:40S ribosomal protein S16 [Tulasnella sp. 403]|nr:40S ribosomal protein S16 [Tulasnella sp. 403]
MSQPADKPRKNTGRWTRGAVKMTSEEVATARERGRVFINAKRPKPGSGPSARLPMYTRLPQRPRYAKQWRPGFKFDWLPGLKPSDDIGTFVHLERNNNKNGIVPFDFWHKSHQRPGERFLNPATDGLVASGHKKKRSSSWKPTHKETKIRVQSFGKKKTATAVAFIRNGRGAIKINSSPIKLVRPEIMRYKIYEPVLILGEHRFSKINMRIRVSGGGQVSQLYAIRQAMAKAIIAYYAKYKDAATALDLKKKLIAYDRSLLISDPRRMEAKKFGGRGARARRQKSYR